MPSVPVEGDSGNEEAVDTALIILIKTVQSIADSPNRPHHLPQHTLNPKSQISKELQ
jgi:hypothetical protein